MTELSPSLIKRDELTALFGSRQPLVWIVTREEQRALPYIFAAAEARKLVTHIWDVAAGSTKLSGEPDGILQPGFDPDAPLNKIRERSNEPAVWVLRGYQPWITQGGPNPLAAATLQRLVNLLNWLPTKPLGSVVILSTNKDVPEELATSTKVIEWPLPDRVELGALLDATVKPYVGKIRPLSDTDRDDAIAAAIGLTGREAQACFAASIIRHKRIDPPSISQEKKAVIAREGGGMEWIDPPKDVPDGEVDILDQLVGGNDEIKDWFRMLATAYTPEAREFGLVLPKGAVLTGIAGCGKSMLVKAGAAAAGVPCIKVDLGALKGKFVGESEANIRKTFATAEALGRCWLWFDEIEKAMSGAVDGSADGGVSADALGFLLTWLQENHGECFVVATCNDITKLPPELTRKGRFDEVWWVNFPEYVERKQIMAATLRNLSKPRDPGKFDLDAIAEATKGFTGAEIAALVPAALFAAFSDGKREPTTADLLRQAQDVVPMGESRRKEMEALRLKTKARPAARQTVEADNIAVEAGDAPLLNI